MRKVRRNTRQQENVDDRVCRVCGVLLVPGGNCGPNSIKNSNYCCYVCATTKKDKLNESREPLPCKMCGVQLIVGTNWTIGRRRCGLYRCSTCDTAIVLEEARARPDKIKARTRKRGRSLSGRYHTLKQSAKRRDVVCLLTVEEYAILTQNPCHYCGFPLPEAGAGLDQKIAGDGYTITNSVPCCKVCNMAKGSFFSYEEFLPFGRLIRDTRLAREDTHE